MLHYGIVRYLLYRMSNSPVKSVTVMVLCYRRDSSKKSWKLVFSAV